MHSVQVKVDVIVVELLGLVEELEVQGVGQGRGRDEDSRGPSERDSRTRQLQSSQCFRLYCRHRWTRYGTGGSTSWASRTSWTSTPSYLASWGRPTGKGWYRRRTTEGCPGCRGRRCEAGSLRAEGDEETVDSAGQEAWRAVQRAGRVGQARGGETARAPGAAWRSGTGTGRVGETASQCRAP